MREAIVVVVVIVVVVLSAPKMGRSTGRGGGGETKKVKSLHFLGPNFFFLYIAEKNMMNNYSIAFFLISYYLNRLRVYKCAFNTLHFTLCGVSVSFPIFVALLVYKFLFNKTQFLVPKLLPCRCLL